MRSRNHLTLLLCLLVGLMVLTPVASADPGVDEYEVIDLGFGRALAVNDRGEVVGDGQPSLTGHAFVWQPDGTMTDLHVAAGWGSQSRSSAYAINKHGEIVGQVCCEVPQTYYVNWDRRTSVVEAIAITIWPSPGDINRHGAVVGGEIGDAYRWTAKTGRVGLAEDGLMNAVRINDHGQVLGITSSHFVPGYPSGLHFVIRERDSSLTPVAFFEMTPTSPPFGQIGDINNQGQVVYSAYSMASANVVGVLWDPKNGVTDYEGLRLTAINDHGVMAGSWSGMPVLVNDDASLVELPVPEGWIQGGVALDVNNKGVAVGTLHAPDGHHAVVWIPAG